MQVFIEGNMAAQEKLPDIFASGSYAEATIILFTAMLAISPESTYGLLMVDDEVLQQAGKDVRKGTSSPQRLDRMSQALRGKRPTTTKQIADAEIFYTVLKESGVPHPDFVWTPPRHDTFVRKLVEQVTAWQGKNLGETFVADTSYHLIDWALKTGTHWLRKSELITQEDNQNFLFYLEQRLFDLLDYQVFHNPTTTRYPHGSLAQDSWTAGVVNRLKRLNPHQSLSGQAEEFILSYLEGTDPKRGLLAIFQATAELDWDQTLIGQNIRELIETTMEEDGKIRQAAQELEQELATGQGQADSALREKFQAIGGFTLLFLSRSLIEKPGEATTGKDILRTQLADKMLEIAFDDTDTYCQTMKDAVLAAIRYGLVYWPTVDVNYFIAQTNLLTNQVGSRLLAMQRQLMKAISITDPSLPKIEAREN